MGNGWSIAAVTATVALATPMLGVGPATAAATAPTESPARISWHRCDDHALASQGARCADVRVPLDPADPTGTTIRLAVSRIAHTSGARTYRGALLVNPGGPGGSGLDLSLIANNFPESVRSRYDWIGFDPRGVGESRPRLSCIPDYSGFARPDYFPKPSSNEKKWLKRTKQYAQACAADGGTLLDHMRTTDSAADMEFLRAALRSPTLNFFGFSYGTYLAQVYATQYPDRVGRMVLDSNVDPQRAFYQANLDQDLAMQKILNRWYAWIADNPRQFGLGNTRKKVSHTYRTIERRLAQHPAKGKIGSSEWTDIFNEVTYSTAVWASRADLFAKYARTGRGGPLVKAYRQTAMFGDDNMLAVYNAVQCTDAPWPADWSTWKSDAWSIYPKSRDVVWMNTWFNAPCLYWPAPAGPRVTVGNESRLLLIGGSDDGATPFSGSLTVRRLFPRSSLVELTDTMSHAVSLDNSCSRRIINRYLGKGELPRRKSGDRPDVRCTPDPTGLS
ncbi:MAG: alpha/beta fold hydrolase [Candidatus Nanopelagicales bacterium]